MSTFDWMELPNSSYVQEQKIELKERLHETRAKRRGLDMRVTNLMYTIRDLEVQRSALADLEDLLEDQLERMKL